jgi:DNA-directed RNA polymerase alpha subunit
MSATVARVSGMKASVTICDLCSSQVEARDSVRIGQVDVCTGCHQRPIADLVSVIEARRAAEQQAREARKAAQRVRLAAFGGGPAEGSVAFLNLSVRASNVLSRHSVRTIEDLTRLRRKDLEDMRNLGGKAVEEIVGALTAHGLALADAEPVPTGADLSDQPG